MKSSLPVPQKEKVSKDDLLFHASHGLCRVTAVSVNPKSRETTYELLPVLQNYARTRFLVPETVLADSGFNKLISVREARAILEYFKTGKKKSSNAGSAWVMAEEIRLESRSDESARGSKTRQRMTQCVRGLSSELAYVLQLSVKEICEIMKGHLSHGSAIHQPVMAALMDAQSD